MELQALHLYCTCRNFCNVCARSLFAETIPYNVIPGISTIRIRSGTGGGGGEFLFSGFGCGNE